MEGVRVGKILNNVNTFVYYGNLQYLCTMKNEIRLKTLINNARIQIARLTFVLLIVTIVIFVLKVFF